MRTCFDTLVLFTVARFQLAYVEFKRSREFPAYFAFLPGETLIFLCHPNLHEELEPF